MPLEWAEGYTSALIGGCAVSTVAPSRAKSRWTERRIIRLYKRDGGTCHLCGLLVPSSESHRHHAPWT